MNEHTPIDDRFDRRELLLHLGDILEALNCLVRTNKVDATVAQLMREEDSLQEFEFLRALEPDMTVTEFGAGIASAFFLWPKALLEAELNHNVLASTVQHDLFLVTLTAGKCMPAMSRKRCRGSGAGFQR